MQIINIKNMKDYGTTTVREIIEMLVHLGFSVDYDYRKDEIKAILEPK